MRKLIGKRAIISLLVALLSLNSTSLFAWGGKRAPVRGTHPFIVEQAVEILRNDLAAGESPQILAAFDLLAAYIGELKDGAIAPDYQNQIKSLPNYWSKGRGNYEFFQDHFYDPTIGANFTVLNIGTPSMLYYVNETAEFRTRENVARALHLWRKGQTREAIFYLGVALHYFSDLSQPHHAANMIGGPFDEAETKHSTFEHYVDDIINSRKAPYYESILLTTVGGKSNTSLYRESLNYSYIADFLRIHSQRASLFANRSYYKDIKPFLEPDNNAKWGEAARKNLHKAQAGAAVVIYRFLREAIKDSYLTTEPTILSVRVKTRSEGWFFTYGYGTDDNIFFGVELKDGRVTEWLLDYSGYNDFEAGENETYYPVLEGEYACRASDIRKAWIRKDNRKKNNSDDWWPLEVQLSAESGGTSINFTRTINRKIDGNFGYIWNLNSSGELIRFPPAR